MEPTDLFGGDCTCCKLHINNSLRCAARRCVLTYVKDVFKDTRTLSPTVELKTSAMTFSLSLVLLMLAVWEVQSSALFGKSARGRLEREERSALRRVKREGGWTYGSGNNGVNYWTHLYGSCGGKFQSPINIDTENLVFNKGLGDFIFDNSDTENVIVKVINDGHTVKVVYQQGGLHGPLTWASS
ncbi:uncharacterized protein LOC112564576 isoform X2 [Pomacea canaliculata]|uniref:uncharacterized protein LOC112564576 isoform X2 n=1 Tax=Pomacea canaliculata TaxID=400727 RepID=UPI000D736433|nr:uncharacterized protein LOC112564576 isoform X2 [Pomacea canaliculata]